VVNRAQPIRAQRLVQRLFMTYGAALYICDVAALELVMNVKKLVMVYSLPKS